MWLDKQRKYTNLTCESTKRMEDPIACITSTAEQTDDLTAWISPWELQQNLIEHLISTISLNEQSELTYPCPSCNWKAESASFEILNGPR